MANPIMRFFEASHLPADSSHGQIAMGFKGVAEMLDNTVPDSAEKSAGLRKLLEAKDCMVRAALPPVE